MAEMHPILWSRVTDRKLGDPDRVKVINLSKALIKKATLGVTYD
jgi:nitrate reductase NapA